MGMCVWRISFKKDAMYPLFHEIAHLCTSGHVYLMHLLSGF